MASDRSARPLPSAAEVAQSAPTRSRSRNPARKVRRWYRRTSRRDMALTMIVLGFAFLVLALTLIVVL